MNVFFDTIGCRLNQAEIEQMAAQFRAAGHKVVGSAQTADVVVINTCAVTSAAASDSRQKTRQAYQSGAQRIYLTGCWATLKPEDAAALRGVSDVILNPEKMDLPTRVLEQVGRDFKTEEILREPLPGVRRRTRAFIKVQDGCDNHCTFCITRLARGRCLSMPKEKVLNDIHAAEERGVREVVLSGVNLGSWGKDLAEGESFTDLLAFLLANTRVERIRLSSIEPWDIEGRFFRLWENPRMCRHLHLPLQSGSMGVLRRMARHTSPADFENLVSLARKSIPGVAITTDVIVGFPGETEEEFHESLHFVEKMSFAGGHVFRFSPREGTAAALLPGRINGVIARERALKMQSLLKRSEDEFLSKAIGLEIPVLWEGSARKEGNLWILQGLSDNYMKVRVRATKKRWNRIDPVRIESVNGGVLEGCLVNDENDSPSAESLRSSQQAC